MKRVNLERKDWTDQELSRALGALPRRTPPADLRTTLRVLASRERERRLTRGTFRAAWAALRDRAYLFVNNLMRPLALPLAGGVFSTVVLFSMWMVPTFPVRGETGPDVPTVLSTEAAVKGTAAIAVGDAADVVVDVTVDGDGRMVDYTVVSGKSALTNEIVRRSLENRLLFTEFKSATQFGRPISGKVRLGLRANSVEVKG